MLNLDCVGWGDEFRLIIAREADLGLAKVWASTLTGSGMQAGVQAIISPLPPWASRLRSSTSSVMTWSAAPAITCGVTPLIWNCPRAACGDALVTAWDALADQSTPIHDLYLPLTVNH